MASNTFGPVNYDLIGSNQPDPLARGFGAAAAKTGFGRLAPTTQPQKPETASVNVKSIRGNGDSSDLRAKLVVPTSYITYTTSGGGVLRGFDGIIFPYTPTITYDVKADYSPQAPVHTNFSQHFYQRSSIGTISLTAKFTVQNEAEAKVYISVIHLLKALTKMRVGDDKLAGSPPPVCRLSAYGPFMLDRVPVAVTSFRVDLPDTIDYFTLGKLSPDPVFGNVSVPTLSTISINMLPMFSRAEMQNFSIDKWLSQTATSDFKKKGYL